MPIGIGVLLFQVDHAPVSFQVEEQEVRIASFWYECEVFTGSGEGGGTDLRNA